MSGEDTVVHAPQKAQLHEPRQDGVAQCLFQAPETMGLSHSQSEFRHLEKLSLNSVNQMLEQPRIVVGGPPGVATFGAEVNHVTTIPHLAGATSMPLLSGHGTDRLAFEGAGVFSMAHITTDTQSVTRSLLFNLLPARKSDHVVPSVADGLGRYHAA